MYANNKSGNKIIVEVAGESSKLNFEVTRRLHFDPCKSYILSGEFSRLFTKYLIKIHYYFQSKAKSV